MRINSKKYIRNMFSSLVCFSVVTSSVAGFAYQVDYAGGNADFKLSGKTAQEMGGQIVTLKVEKGGNVEYTRQTETNRLGEYTFDFNVLEDSYGDINVIINEGSGPETKTFYKSSPGEVERALASVNLTGVRAAISSNDSVTSTPVHKVLQLKAEDFTETGLITAYFSGKTFDTLDALLKEYEKGKFLQELENPSSIGEVLFAMMNECEMAEILSGNTAKVFEAYTENEKQQMLNGIKGNRFTNDNAFKKALYDAVLINELSKVSTDTEKWAVLSQNNDYLSLGLSTYENSSVFTSLKTQLFANTITSIDTMKSNIAVIYSTLTSPPPGGDDGGGGGGGGGGKHEYPSASSDLVTSLTDSPKFGFNDLNGYEWAEDAILSLAADGIINGKAQSVFAPADNVTRAEFAKIIIGAFDLVADNTLVSFKDVPASHWGYRYIASAASKGIVNGISAQMFNPDGKITRQDMATICYRVLASKGIATDSANAKKFMDAGEISDYAKTAVDVLSSLGIINGKGDGIFAPDNFATRAEAAKIIHSLRKLK